MLFHTPGVQISGNSLLLSAALLQRNQMLRMKLFLSLLVSEINVYLLDFLLILQLRRVEWVWLDAVCINQTDSTEKDREIQNMGTYYQKSLGCFVVHHGFGRGFSLLPDDASREEMRQFLSSQDILPRWYTRAWTFQEWVLPSTVTFVIDLSSEQILRKSACILYLSWRREYGFDFCTCCHTALHTISAEIMRDCITMASSQYLRCPKRSKWYIPPLPSKGFGLVAHNLTCCAAGFCNHFTTVPTKDHWYFADDVGVLFLFKLLYHSKNVFHNRSVELFQDDIGDRVRAKHLLFRNRNMTLETHEPRIFKVIQEISKRDCSNPEDRVLSVLKLLGVDQMLQVRTGRTLRRQLFELGKTLLNAGEEETLLKVCVVDPFGSKLPGMSWMADFETEKGTWQEEAKFMRFWMSSCFLNDEHEYRKATSMERLGICTETGALEARAHVCAGILIFCDHDEEMQGYRMQKFDDAYNLYEKYSYRTAILQVDGQAVFHLCARVSEKSTCFLQGLHIDDTSHIAFPTTDVHALHRMDILCLLVCIGDQQSGLHKIGYITVQQGSWFEFNSKLTSCRIGGQGDWNANTISL